MNTFFTPDRLRSLFQNQFNLSEWLTYLQQFFLADKLRVKPEQLDTTNEQGYSLGAINTPDHYHIGYQITAYADTKYDENIWNKIVRYAVRNPYVFATSAVAMKKY